MANPRKSKALRVIEGTYRPDRDYGEAELPPARNTEPPDSLISPDAVALWEKVTRLLGPVRILTDADLDLLLHYANLHAKLLKLWRAGETPTAALLTQLRLMAGEFGLTPASRSRAGRASEPDDEPNPAEEFFK